jgi:hypothetical protein
MRGTQGRSSSETRALSFLPCGYLDKRPKRNVSVVAGPILVRSLCAVAWAPASPAP